MVDRVVLARLPACGLLNLRRPTGATGLASLIGLALPDVPCTYTLGPELRVFWLGPGEWLVAVTAGAAEELEDRLRSALDGSGAVVDVSAGYVRYNLHGPGAAELLMAACPYDFDRRTFGAGRCVQTVFAKTTALVAGCEDASFDILIRRSYADYFERWTADAASTCAESALHG